MYLVIDTETGGLDVRIRPILTIGYLIVSDSLNRVVRKRHLLIKAKASDCVDRALKINAIDLKEHNKSAISSARAVSIMLEDAERYFDGKFVVVGHNVSFDIKFLRKLFGDCGERFVYSHNIIDTRQLSSMLIRLGKLDAKNASLSHLVDRLQIRSRGRGHDAIVDASNTLKLLRLLSDSIPTIPIP